MLDKKEMIESLYKSGTISKKEYHEMLERVESKAVTDTSITSLLDGFEEYLKNNFSKHTASGYVSNTKNYFEFLHGEESELPKDASIEISSENVQKWLNSLATKGYSGTSIRRYKNSFSKFVEYVNEHHGLGAPDVSSVSVPDTPDKEDEVDAITDSEVKELAENAGSLRDKLIIMMMYELGLKRQELVDLVKSDVDIKSGIVKIRKDGSVSRTGILSKGTIKMYEDYLDEWISYVEDVNEKRRQRGDKNIVVVSDYVFQTLRSEKISYAVVFKAVAEASKSTYGDEKEVTTETLRRSRRVFYFSEGYDTQKVQALMGDTNYHVCKRSLRIAQILYPEKFMK